MAFPAAGITGWGLAVPETRLTNDQLASLVDTSDEWIRTRTGIRERRVLANGKETSDLATTAARRALVRAGVAPEAVDTVIVATVSGDMAFPNAACLVQHKLGCANAAAFDLGAACSGYIYALVQGAMMIETGRAGCVLVVGADALSKLLDWTDRSTCVLFGDGAGASVLQRVPDGYGLLGSHLGSDGSGGMLLHAGAPVDGRAERSLLTMDGRQVFRFAVRIQAEACERALADAGLEPSDIDWLVPHQANIRIIEAAAERFSIPRERVVINVDRYGNTSAASIPLAIAEAADAGKFRAGDRILMVGFGAGLTWGAAVVRWSAS